MFYADQAKNLHPASCNRISVSFLKWLLGREGSVIVVESITA